MAKKVDERIRVAKDTKYRYITLLSKNNDSLSVKKKNLFTPIKNYNFYYNTKFIGITPTENFLEAVSHALTLYIEKFYSEVSTKTTESEINNLIDFYLNPLKANIPPNEITEKTDVNRALIGYVFGSQGGILTTSDFESIVSNSNPEIFYYGILKKLLYWSIYDPSGKNEVELDKEIVRKTFKSFGTSFNEELFDLSSNPHLYLYGDIDTYVDKLYEDIEKVFRSLSDRSFKDISIKIGDKKYSIKVDELSDEIPFLENFRKLYEDAKKDYEGARKKNNYDKANKIRESLFEDYYKVGTEYMEVSEYPYAYFVSKWQYYCAYIFEESSIENYIKGDTLRERDIIIHNLDNVIGRIKIKSDFANTIESGDKNTVDITIKGAISNKKHEYYISEEIINNVNKDFNDIDRETDGRTKVESVFSLSSVDTIFGKTIYSPEEGKLYNRIGEYWEGSIKLFKDLIEQGKINASKFLKSIILGEYDIRSYHEGAIELRKTLHGHLTDIDIYDPSKETSIYITNKKDWELSVTDINKGSLFDNMFDARTYNILDLYSYFCFYKYTTPLPVSKAIDDRNFTLKYQEYSYEGYPINFTFTSIKNKDKKNEFRDELKKELKRILDLIEKGAEEDLEAERALDKVTKQFTRYEESEEEIRDRIVEVEDFFYVDKKHLPIGKFIDIDFIFYKDGTLDTMSTISVTKRRGKKLKDGIYEDNYFSSMELRDLGGTKEIDLVLKSADETNLENLIYRSMIEPIESYNNISSDKSRDYNELYKVLSYKNANFRVRFGYSDYYESGIKPETMLESGFRERVKEKARTPVVSTPWMYFTIKNITSRTVNNEMFYEIGGVTLGKDMLDDFTIYTNNSTSLISNRNSPKGGLSFASTILSEASNGKIAIISENNKVFHEDGSKRIIFNDSNKEAIIKGIVDDIPDRWTFGNVGSNMMGIDSAEKEKDIDLRFEQSKNKTLSVKDVLKNISDWLPKKYYVTATDNNTGIKYADEYSYDKHKELKNSRKLKGVSVVSLSPTYEAIEVEAKIGEEEHFETKTLIRFFYKGPISEKDEDMVRKYTFRHKQNTVVKSLSIENEVNIGNVKEYCSVVGSSNRKIFSSSFNTENLKYPKSEMLEEVSAKENGIILVPKKNFIIYDKIEDDTLSAEELRAQRDKIENEIASVANEHISKMEVWPFNGELEILGDPFYLFDDKLQMSKYKIYIDTNRINSLGDSEKDYLRRSYYTGVYLVTGIEHRIDSDGDFTTTLSILKDITK